jgi:alpha-tubulin suppressor-like RCC1 family protein
MVRGHRRRVVACCLFLCGILSLGFARNLVYADVNETSVNSSTRLPQSAISLGAGHSCAIVEAGNIKCWGRNDFGQLGDNSLNLRQFPVNVTGSTESFTQLALGEYFSCGLSSSGRVFCWGRNTNGQLGLSNTIDKKTITSSVISLSNVASISAGNNFACAIVSSSTSQLKCWGQNADGQLGIGSLSPTMVPTSSVSLTSQPVAISAGNYHACSLGQSGNVQCWGQNQAGQLGNGTSGADVTTPIGNVPLAGPAIAISSGSYHSCALLNDGNVQCWGQNSGGKLGNNSNVHSNSPVTVQGFSNSIASDPVIAISAGQGHTCALTQNKNLYCWGGNQDGEVGDGSTSQRWVATPVTLGSGVVSAITTGYSHSCLALSGGNVQCWGSDQYGQLGNGGGGSTSSPNAVSGPLTGVGVTTTMPPSTSAVSTTSSTTVAATGEPSTNTISSNGSNPTTETTSSGNSNETNSQNGLGDEPTNTTPIRGTTLEPEKDVNDRRIESQQFVILSTIITVLAISTTTSSTSQQGFSGKELVAHRRRRRGEDSGDSDLWDSVAKAVASAKKEDKRKLNEEFKEASKAKRETGGLPGVIHKIVGGLFRLVILVIQQASRIRLFRPGLKRWAEIAILSPVSAAMAPVVVLIAGYVSGILLSNQRLSLTISLLLVFGFAVTAPLFAVLSVTGWAVGRLVGGTSILQVVAEVLVLHIGFLFVPMMIRSVIGPRGQSSIFEFVVSLITAPLIGVIVYQKWIDGFTESVNTLYLSLPNNSENWLSGWSDFPDFSLTSTWVVSCVMSGMVLIVSVLAIRTSDLHGHPFPIVPAHHEHEDAAHLLRHEYAETVKLELGEPRLWNKLVRYGLAGAVMVYGLSDFLGGLSILYAGVFLGANFLCRDLRRVKRPDDRDTDKSPEIKKKESIHPIYRTVIAVGFGVVVSFVAVDEAVLPVYFAAIGVVCVVILVIKTRDLW